MKMIILTLLIAFITNSQNHSVTGRFYQTTEYLDGTIRYQFKSDDNEVWWSLDESEIGHIPNTTDVYVLTYDNNGTTADNKPCDCLPEWECECEVYDDELISIRKTDR